MKLMSYPLGRRFSSPAGHSGSALSPLHKVAWSVKSYQRPATGYQPPWLCSALTWKTG